MTALVTGAGGQDGILVARRLIAEGHRVVGTVRPGWSSPRSVYLAGVEVVEVDLRDHARLDDLVATTRPDEVYHLAAVTSVVDSLDGSSRVEDINDRAVAALLAALRRHVPDARTFLASSAEVFGPSGPEPRTESTPLDPQNPYAVSKARVHEHAHAAREAGQFASVGILFNHESPIRDERFVTRKVTRAVARIAAGSQEQLRMGRLDSRRDWGAAVDVVDAMVRLVRADQPHDVLVATGTLRSVAELVAAAFAVVGIDDSDPYVVQDPAFMRGADTPGRVADISRARSLLGWEPTISFDDLIGAMVRADVERLRTGVEEDDSYL